MCTTRVRVIVHHFGRFSLPGSGPPTTAAEFGREFLAGKVGQVVKTEPSDWQTGFDLLQRYEEQKLSAADATSVAIVRRLDLERAASFDKHFRVLITDRQVVG